MVDDFLEARGKLYKAMVKSAEAHGEKVIERTIPFDPIRRKEIQDFLERLYESQDQAFDKDFIIKYRVA